MTGTTIDAAAFSKTAPDGFLAPSRLVDSVRGRTRAEYILDHGFSAEQINVKWWAARGIEITFPTKDAEAPRLTRRDLFAMGNELESEQDLSSFVWHVLAWGSGNSVRNNLKRLDSIPAHEPLLREALDVARAGDPRTAYSTLVRRGGGVIPSLGPAFFTKLLYFASEGNDDAVGPRTRCLILDARVAGSLYRLGWNMAESYPTPSFSYNWFTDTYVSYCQLLERWADAAGEGVTPDMFERALFQRSRSTSVSPRLD